MIPRQKIQTLLHAIYPPRCVSCGDLVASDFELCGCCWRDTPFIGGAICDRCGVPLPGQVSDNETACDDCMKNPPPWYRGRAALLYEGRARSLVLGLKHGDRHDIARPAAHWMAKVAEPLVNEGTIVAPIPLHWKRYFYRRYNQSALLGRIMAKELGLSYVPDLLQRHQSTRPLDGKTRKERFTLMKGTLTVNPKFRDHVKGASVLLVDDVMTSGATFSAATEACLHSKADQVNVIALARVAMHP